MLPAQRRNIILETIRNEKTIYVNKLSQYFKVTEETIRRDLEKLEKQGYLIRTYGGAILSNESNTEFPVDVRQSINIESKLRIARLAASLVSEGDVLFFDASSTSYYVAKELKNKKGITVITNAIKIVLEFANNRDVEVISTGGHLVSSNLSYYGKNAENAISNYNADKAFISCKGISLEHGTTDSNEEISIMHRIMMTRAREAILLIDASKIDKIAFVNTSNFENIDRMIIDCELDKKWEEVMAVNKVKVNVAK